MSRLSNIGTNVMQYALVLFLCGYAALLAGWLGETLLTRLRRSRLSMPRLLPPIPGTMAGFELKTD